MTQTPQIPVCIAIASRRRPKLLQNALESLAKIDVPKNIDLSFMVVENDDAPQYAPIIEHFKAEMNLSYGVAPEPGLTTVRNKVLEMADNARVEWLATIDDDAVVNRLWLQHMFDAISQHPDTKMFAGLQLRVSPADAPAWLPEFNHHKGKKGGDELRVASTCGLMMNRDAFGNDKMALRFDPYFRFSGGEDSDFTMRYRKAGGKIRFAPKATTTEDVHNGRAGLVTHLRRIVQSRHVYTRIMIRQDGRLKAGLKNLHFVYRGVVLGPVNILLGGLMLPFAEKPALQRVGVGLRFLFLAQGVVNCYFCPLPEMYREQHGD